MHSTSVVQRGSAGDLPEVTQQITGRTREQLNSLAPHSIKRSTSLFLAVLVEARGQGSCKDG